MDFVGFLNEYSTEFINFIILILGILAHFIKAVMVDKKSPTFADYWLQYKGASILSLMSAFVGGFYLWQQGIDNSLGYFGVGYICDSVINRAGKVAEAFTGDNAPVHKAERKIKIKHVKPKVLNPVPKETTPSDEG